MLERVSNLDNRLQPFFPLSGSIFACNLVACRIVLYRSCISLYSSAIDNTMFLRAKRFWLFSLHFLAVLWLYFSLIYQNRAFSLPSSVFFSCSLIVQWFVGSCVWNSNEICPMIAFSTMFWPFWQIISIFCLISVFIQFDIFEFSFDSRGYFITGTLLLNNTMYFVFPLQFFQFPIYRSRKMPATFVNVFFSICR